MLLNVCDIRSKEKKRVKGGDFLRASSTTRRRHPDSSGLFEVIPDASLREIYSSVCFLLRTFNFFYISVSESSLRMLDKMCVSL